MDKLDLILIDKLGASVAPSAISQARQRLTSEPLAAFFDLTAARWIEEEDGKDT
ncbi:transposase domain-containing protein [Oceanisphaera sp. DM8]|uniref:Transposase domain-containing protein n=1 Tax=Oceanisphaera pacifica TaxID=2818389 RepID=A0ABS3NID3_9GAMM|nr:transposase domain-containing protein [Oceanisphaera pacifica]